MGPGPKKAYKNGNSAATADMEKSLMICIFSEAN